MTTLYLIRHGETETNTNRKFAGMYDAKLTAQGKEQAELVARHLAAVPLDAIYSSDLSRALYTAQAIAGPHGLPVLIDAGLREISMGDWEGLSLEQAATGWPDAYRVWMENQGFCRCPNGESISQVQERFSATVNRLMERHPGQTVLAVTHGLALKTLYCEMMKVPLSQFRQQRYVGNASVTILQREDGKLTLKAYGDDQYLGDHTSYIFSEA